MTVDEFMAEKAAYLNVVREQVAEMDAFLARPDVREFLEDEG